MRLYSILLSGALLFGGVAIGSAQEKYEEKTKVDDSKPGKYKEKTKVRAKDDASAYKEDSKVNEKKGKADTTIKGKDEDGSYKEKVKTRTKHGKTSTTVETTTKP